MKNKDEVIKFLEQPIPRDEVATRSGGGKFLSYLETWRVIDLLNEAFGNLGWDCETIENYQVNGRFGKEDDANTKPIYVAKVRIKAIVEVNPGQFINVTKEGTGYGIDKSGLNPHEMAAKEAESDALKRAAMKFGKRLGLALYDKTQEFVTDESNQSKREMDSKNTRTNGGTNPSTTVVTKSTTVDGVSGQSEAAVPRGSAKASRETINKSITAHSKVILDKKLKTQDELKALLTAYGVNKKEDLTDNQAESLLGQLKELVK